MKGVILAGGTGSRLSPLTKVTNKHLLPVYDKPMIYYSLLTLKQAGITDIMIVSGKGHVGSFLELLGSGRDFGLDLKYEVQEKAGGIAGALSLVENFANGEKIVVILGDNVFQDDISKYIEIFASRKDGACVALKEVENPCSYGVATVNEDKLVEIIEKPSEPKSNLAVTGLYMYDNSVFEVVKTLKPSQRGELEITDVNNHYIKRGLMDYFVVQGFWGDCRESFDSLLYTSELVKALSIGTDRAHANLTKSCHTKTSSLPVR
jgi:glucose-1-phosphate thymidylyltransferase